MRRKIVALWGCGGALALAPFVQAAAPKPAPWLAEVAERPTPRLPGDVPVYVLHDELIMTVAPTGTATTERRIARRILTQKGDSHAVASVHYTEKVDKLVSGRAWLVREGKTVKSEDLRKWIDVCMISDGTVFTEERNRMMSFPRESLSRDVFGFETVVTRPMLLPQRSFEFSTGVPTAVERVEVVLPKDWTLTYVTRGAVVAAPVIDAARNSWSWEVRDRPYVPDEDWTPRVDPDAPRVFVTIVPPAGAKGLSFPRVETWSDVGAWIDELGTGQCDSDAALVDTARRLAAAAPDRLALLRAMCAHVQRLRYVAVDRGLGLGFGYQPRKATEVLARGYGDCKDKSNLLRALLREAGITSHLVVIESGRRHPTVDEWPSPTQFNHAISAIEVDGSIDLPTVITASDGRRLLLFDPTDEQTVVGDLPWYLQGASGLLLAGANSHLITVPELPPEVEWRFFTRGQLMVAGNGTATGQVTFGGQRQAGSKMRTFLRQGTARQISEFAARLMSSLLRGVIVRDPRVEDDPVTGEIGLAFALDAPGVLQPGPGGIFIMKLDVFVRDSVPQLGTKERVQPIEIRSVVHDEEITFILPEGFVVDEAPKPAREEGTYGVYERTVVVQDGTVVLRRQLQMAPQVVPAANYPDVRAFLTAAARADKASVVLRHAP